VKKRPGNGVRGRRLARVCSLLGLFSRNGVVVLAEWPDALPYLPGGVVPYARGAISGGNLQGVAGVADVLVRAHLGL
jgi:hypothetical protein